MFFSASLKEHSSEILMDFFGVNLFISASDDILIIHEIKTLKIIKTIKLTNKINFIKCVENVVFVVFLLKEITKVNSYDLNLNFIEQFFITKQTEIDNFDFYNKNMAISHENQITIYSGINKINKNVIYHSEVFLI